MRLVRVAASRSFNSLFHGGHNSVTAGEAFSAMFSEEALKSNLLLKTARCVARELKMERDTPGGARIRLPEMRAEAAETRSFPHWQAQWERENDSVF
jgi:hypothetical protein